jgi:hypothetical protein
MQFSPVSRHFLPPRSEFSPQRSVLTLTLCSSVNVNNRISHPYKTAGNIILYILIFNSLDRNEKTEEGELRCREVPGRSLQIFKEVTEININL